MLLSKEIESGIFEYSLLYSYTNNLIESLIPSVYKYKVAEIIKNISINPDLVTDIKSNRIKPRFVAFMPPSLACPKKWELLLEKKHLKEEKENNLPTTDMYKCRKCDKKKCTVSFLQTR